MKNKSQPNPTRRRVMIYTLAGLLPVPLSSVVLPQSAYAAEHVSEDDPQAKALTYKNDATASARPTPDQMCANCLHIKGDSGDWRPCEIFPGKEVSAKGWCAAWVKKA